MCILSNWGLLEEFFRNELSFNVFFYIIERWEKLVVNFRVIIRINLFIYLSFWISDRLVIVK